MVVDNEWFRQSLLKWLACCLGDAISNKQPFYDFKNYNFYTKGFKVICIQMIVAGCLGGAIMKNDQLL